MTMTSDLDHKLREIRQDLLELSDDCVSLQDGCTGRNSFIPDAYRKHRLPSSPDYESVSSLSGYSSENEDTFSDTPLTTRNKQYRKSCPRRDTHHTPKPNTHTAATTNKPLARSQSIQQRPLPTPPAVLPAKYRRRSAPANKLSDAANRLPNAATAAATDAAINTAAANRPHRRHRRSSKSPRRRYDDSRKKANTGYAEKADVLHPIPHVDPTKLLATQHQSSGRLTDGSRPSDSYHPLQNHHQHRQPVGVFPGTSASHYHHQHHHHLYSSSVTSASGSVIEHHNTTSNKNTVYRSYSCRETKTHHRTTATRSSVYLPQPNQHFHLTTRDRIVATKQIWYLTDVTRELAEKYLRYTELGCFIVRRSSRGSRPLILSVRIPSRASVHYDVTSAAQPPLGGGPVEHYIISPPLGGGPMYLEGATRKFIDLHHLLDYYYCNLDGLPVQLRLPSALHHTPSIDQLTRYNLLGQDFWTSDFNGNLLPEVSPYSSPWYDITSGGGGGVGGGGGASSYSNHYCSSATVTATITTAVTTTTQSAFTSTRNRHQQLTASATHQQCVQRHNQQHQQRPKSSAGRTTTSQRPSHHSGAKHSHHITNGYHVSDGGYVNSATAVPSYHYTSRNMANTVGDVLTVTSTPSPALPPTVTNGCARDSREDYASDREGSPLQSTTTLVVPCNSNAPNKSRSTTPVSSAPGSPSKKGPRVHTSIVQSHINGDVYSGGVGDAGVGAGLTNGYHRDDVVDGLSESSLEFDKVVKANRNYHRKSHNRKSSDACVRLCEKYNLAYDSESSSVSYEDGSTSDTSYKGSVAPQFVSLKRGAPHHRHRKTEPEVFTFDTTSVDDVSSINNDDTSRDVLSHDEQGSLADGEMSSCSESFDAKICKIFGVPSSHLQMGPPRGGGGGGGGGASRFDDSEYMSSCRQNGIHDSENLMPTDHGFSDSLFGEDRDAFTKHRLLLHESAQHVIDAVNRLSHHLNSQSTPSTSTSTPGSVPTPSPYSSHYTPTTPLSAPTSHTPPTNHPLQTPLGASAQQQQLPAPTAKFMNLMNKINQKYSGSAQDVSEPCQTGSHLPRHSFNDNLISPDYLSPTTDTSQSQRVPIRAQSVPRQMNQANPTVSISAMSAQKTKSLGCDASSDSELDLMSLKQSACADGGIVDNRPPIQPGSAAQHSVVFRRSMSATTANSNRQFPLVHNTSSRPHSSVSDVTTIDDVISDVSPELTLQPIQVQALTMRNLKRLSDYDNMNAEEFQQRFGSSAGETGVNSGVGDVPTPSRTAVSSGTFYCNPWDSTLWDDILNLGSTAHQQDHQKQHVLAQLNSSTTNNRVSDPDYNSDLEYGNMYNINSPTDNDHPTSHDPPATSPPASYSSSAPPSSHHIRPSSQRYSQASSAAARLSSSSGPLSFPVASEDRSHGCAVGAGGLHLQVDSPAENISSDPCRTPSAISCASGISHLSSFSTQHQHEAEGNQEHEHRDRQVHHQAQQHQTQEHQPQEQQPHGAVQQMQKNETNTLEVNTDTVIQRPKSQRSTLSPPRLMSLRRRASSGAGENIRQFIYKLSNNNTSWFGASVEKFIHCTEEGTESNPHVVIRNVRQYMNGIKNYLVCNKEGGLYKIIEQESAKLKGDEFLNVDSILEAALHRCILGPLKQHIYKLFVNEYKRTGNLDQLSENIKYARTRTPQQLGIRSDLSPPSHGTMEIFKHFMDKMQRAFSPLKKLENLLGATSAIYACVQNPVQVESLPEGVSLGADDFLPMFIYALSHCGVVSAEIEADYMWGLLHPCLLAGEGGYHLTTLSSAVHVLKNLKTAAQTQHNNTTNLPLHKQPHMGSVNDLQGFIKIVIPDELNDSISVKTLPVKPTMTCQQVADMIAHKFRITNPQNYGLYVVVDGAEDSLLETNQPHSIQTEIMDSGHDCVFAYKRNNAKFAWPKTFM